MALGTLGTAVAAPLITAGVTYGASKLFGPKPAQPATAPLQNFQPTGFTGGGFSSTFNNGNLSIAPTSDRLGLIGGLSGNFGNLASELSGLRSRVAPGVGDLSRARLGEVDVAREARLGEIENARTAAIGNLRENLQRRRVLGSSFGQDALTRAESEFAQERERVQAATGAERERVAAESFLQEFEMTNQLINQQFEAQRLSFQTGLDELNLEAGIAAQLSASASKSMATNAQFLAGLNAKEAEGAGKFFGDTFNPVFKAVGDAGGKIAGSYTPDKSFPIFAPGN